MLTPSDILPAKVTDGGEMSQTIPHYSAGQVNKAGYVIRNPHAPEAEMNAALQVMNDWRSAHSTPLHRTLRSLGDVATSVDPKVLIAEGLKRFPSIVAKLQRESRMMLS